MPEDKFISLRNNLVRARMGSVEIAVGEPHKALWLFLSPLEATNLINEIIKHLPEAKAQRDFIKNNNQ